MKTFITLDADKLVYSIIASGAYTPQMSMALTPEQFADDMAKYAMLVKRAVLRAINEDQKAEDPQG